MRFPRPRLWGERPPPDERVDRPEVEAPRGAREPTGTNGPTLNKHPKHVMRGETIQATQCRNHYAHHDQPTPHHQVGSVLNTNSCGGHSTGETPSTIPNLEAKPGSANGTATDRLWESRTPPQHNKTRGTAPPHGVPSLSTSTPTTSHQAKRRLVLGGERASCAPQTRARASAGIEV